MPVELQKVTPTRLRLLGLDERWLQVRIEEDPSQRHCEPQSKTNSEQAV